MECLEERIVPATWPINQNPLQVLGTYGQYQDVNQPVDLGTPGVEAGNYDTSIHLHEGLDISAAAGTAVRSVLAGRVEAVFTSAAKPYDSFVVIRDVMGGMVQATGFNYKHTVPLAGLAVGANIAEGAQIGTVAAPPQGITPHIHLDRGNNGNTRPMGANNSRDPGVATDLLPIRDANIAQWRLNLRALNRIPPARRTPQHTAQITALTNLINDYPSYRTGIRWWFSPTINPMSVLQPVAQDQVAPTVQNLHYRIGADDEFGTRAGEAEALRSDSRYFQTLLTVGTQQRIHLGRLATGLAQSGAQSASGQQNNANIDFVVEAYDRFGPANQPLNTKLNPNRFDITVTGQAFGVTSGQIRSFDFSAFPTYQGVSDFANAGNTRAAYENDTTHNSIFTGPFYHTLTNSPNLNVAPGGATQEGDIQDDHMDLFWNSDAAAGESFVAEDNNDDANSNATARFADDIYTITIGATDFHGNRGTEDFSVVLTNWQRTVTTNATIINMGGALTVTGGNQYRANQTNIGVHLVAANPPMGGAAPTNPTDGTTLNNANRHAQANANANGVLQNVNLANLPNPGRYFLIVDYNGDGEYTKHLDAFTVVTLRGNAGAQLNINPQNSNLGQYVTLTANVFAEAPATGTPTGEVYFYDEYTTLGVSPLVDGVATLVVNTLSASGDVTADYLGNDSFAPTSATTYHTVNQPEPMNKEAYATLVVDSSASVFGESVTLTATVIASPPDTGAPTGIVSFFGAGMELGSPTLDQNGMASITVNSLPVGSHNLVADYQGDAEFQFTSAYANHDVNPGDTTVIFTESPASSTYGDAVEFSVTVSADSPSVGVPTGTIELYDGSTFLDSVLLDNGSAVFTINGLTGGVHTLTASYLGNSNFNSSTVDTSHTVLTQSTTIDGYTLPNPNEPWVPPFTLSQQPPALPPANTTFTGEQISLIAEIEGTSPGESAPTGTIEFYEGSTLLGSASVIDGEATLNISGRQVGTYDFTYSYSGDANYDSSSDVVTHTVVPGESTTTFSTDYSQYQEGQPVTLTATLSANSPANGTPSGIVEFYDGDNLLGSVSLNGGVASLTVSSLPAGFRELTAYYVGDTEFEASFEFADVIVGDSAAIRGDVWDDANGDGIQDVDEFGFSDIPVELHDEFGSFLDSTTTDEFGSFQFLEINAGNYQLRFTAPPDFVFTQANNPYAGEALDSDVTTLLQGNLWTTDIFTLGTGELRTDIDGGLTTSTGGSGGGGGGSGATISGQVFDDVDGNGIQNAGESGIGQGIIVYLFNAMNGELVASTTVDQNGEYTFTGLAAGDYYLQFELPPSMEMDYYFTSQDQGSDDTLDSDVDLNGMAYFTLLTDEVKDDLDAGLVYSGYPST